jgi:hypothetical protein
MATLKKIESASAALSTPDSTKSTKLNLYTLPCEVFTVAHGTTQDEKRAKVIFKAVVGDEDKGTIQIFAPFGKDAELLATFEAEDVIDGSENQDCGLYFELTNGSNYQLVSEAKAKKLMELTGCNSTPMEFPAKVNKWSQSDVQNIKNINAGNVGKVAVATKGGVASWLGNAFK